MTGSYCKLAMRSIVPKPRRSKVLWSAYVKAMEAASDAALVLANALEIYLRKGVHRDVHPSFDYACSAADAYSGAIRRAEPFHCGTIRTYYSGHVINLSADELLEVIRELRGTVVYHREARHDGTSTMFFRYADDGIAGFFRRELTSMEPFGSPRRMPTKEELTMTFGHKPITTALPGSQYGKWTVKGEAPRDKHGKRRVHAWCDCGTKTIVSAHSLVAKTSKSCSMCCATGSPKRKTSDDADRAVSE